MEDIFTSDEIADYCNREIDINDVYDQDIIDGAATDQTIYDNCACKDLSKDIVQTYYEKRGLKTPDPLQALLFLVSEIGELADSIVQNSDWVRNNPSKQRVVDDEIGDVLMMLTVFSLQQTGVVPIYHMKNKINRKLKELKLL